MTIATSFITNLSAERLNQIVQSIAGLEGGPLLYRDAVERLVNQVNNPLKMVFRTATELTIATGEITVTQTSHTVDTAGDAASDDLDTINGLDADSIIFLRPASAARTVVVKHGTGNIYCPGGRDISLAEATDWVMLIGDGTNATVIGSNTLAADTLPDLIFDAATELTIATGVITATQAAHKVDTEGDAASDDLDTINGGTAEEVIFLRLEDAARNVVLKHNTGNIQCPDGLDITLDTANDMAVLYYDGSNWIVLWASLATSTPMKDLRLQPASELTIATGAITATQGAHKVDTEGDAASDNLDTVNGVAAEELVLLRLEDAARNVVIRDIGVSGGNIYTPEALPLTLDVATDWVLLVGDGTNVTVLAYSLATQRPSRFMLVESAESLVIATGAIVPTQGSFKIDTEGGAASDDLDTVTATNLQADSLVFVRLEDATHNVVLKDGTGNLSHPEGIGDITLDTLNDLAIYFYDGSQLRLVAWSLDTAAAPIAIKTQADTELTIATGEITVTQSYHNVDTEGDAASDDLDTINGGVEGQFYVLQLNNAARNVVLKHNTGNIQNPAGIDITLDVLNDKALLLYDGSNFVTLAVGMAVMPALLDLRFQGATELTIATGVITATQAAHSVDTEGDAASDDLDTINGGTAEEVIFLRLEDAARNVVLKHNTGNIQCPDGLDITLDTANDMAVLYYDGSNWIVIGICLATSTPMKDLRFQGATELTIATGVITVTQAAHSVDTEGDAASDDLDTINGGTAEEMIFLRAEDAARTVVIKHATGNIYCPDARDISLAEANDFAVLYYNGSNWSVIASNTLARDTLPELIFDAATELTIATGAITVSKAYHTVDTEADAASDDLDTINGIAEGEIVFLRPVNAARTVVVKHNTGNILCPGALDITLAEISDYVVLTNNGTNVVVLAYNTLATDIHPLYCHERFVNPPAPANIVTQRSADFDLNEAAILGGGGTPLPSYADSGSGGRDVQIAFSGTWDGGDVEVTGIRMDGSIGSETITSNPGSTVAGVYGYSYLTRLRNLGTRTAGTVDPQWGIYLAVPIGDRTPTLIRIFETSAGTDMTPNGAIDSNGLVDIQDDPADGTNDYIVAYTLEPRV